MLRQHEIRHADTSTTSCRRGRGSGFGMRRVLTRGAARPHHHPAHPLAHPLAQPLAHPHAKLGLGRYHDGAHERVGTLHQGLSALALIRKAVILRMQVLLLLLWLLLLIHLTKQPTLLTKLRLLRRRWRRGRLCGGGEPLHESCQRQALEFGEAIETSEHQLRGGRV